MKETTAIPTLPDVQPTVDRATFRNKLAEQDRSILNLTYTVDTTKAERQREFQHLADILPLRLPRARSSGPRRSFKEITTPMRNYSDTSIFSSTCMLPAIDGISAKNKCCQLRPWSRTQEELRKFKQTLNRKQ